MYSFWQKYSERIFHILQLICSAELPGLSQAVFWIHDILVWIRIRIRGSMPLTNGSGSCNFCHWPSRCQQKTNFLTQFFLLVTFWRHIYIIIKDKKSKRVTKNNRIQGFSYYFCMMIEGSGSRAGSGSIPLTSGSGSGMPKKHVDPEHWSQATWTLGAAGWSWCWPRPACNSVVEP